MKKLIVLVCLLLGLTSVFADDEFPYRVKYPGLTPISSVDLEKEYLNKNVVIVDVRSKIEYDVIHPIDAIHLPVSDKLFTADVQAILKGNKGKLIAFYCNGITCLKSYEAAERAMKETSYPGIRVYDAGIPDWSVKYPEKTLLLGEIIKNPKEQLISKEELNKHMLTIEEFTAKSKEPNAFVVDARDFIQNSGSLPGFENSAKIPFDKLIPNIIEKKHHIDKTLLIFDQVGKQVHWLMYYMVKNGYTNYYFLKGGATEVLKKQDYRK
ncbi:MAG: hypothetical protein A2Y40_06140 [Candidatus Margulisbacteria bacterium GWF2_35_9]|nr:MAG: hypothetical protein A2Y40_06140 [Candidatus Margulisbacteria bacterium GWF2_35_9]